MYWLLALSTVCAAGKAVICKNLSAANRASRSVYAWNSGIYLIAAVVAFFALYPDFSALLRVSPFTVGAAFVFAFLLLFTQITEVKAMSLGSVSLTILIYSGGFILPILYGLISLNEIPSPLRWGGIALMAVAMGFIIRPRKEGNVSIAWIVLSFLSLIGSGMVAVTQKYHQNTAHKDELASFVMLGLLFAAVLSFVVAVVKRAKAQKPPPPAFSDVGFVLIAGLCIGLQNLLNVFLAGKLAAAIQFPVYNIGSMILTALFGILVLKERYTVSQKIGFALGCLSIVLIGL